jgi:uncharacterized membrane protein YvlD (DUF360 family)
MDFIVRLSKTQTGFNCIFVVVDQLTKTVHFISTILMVISFGVVELFMKDVLKILGMPSEIAQFKISGTKIKLERLVLEFHHGDFHILGSRLGG